LAAFPGDRELPPFPASHNHTPAVRFNELKANEQIGKRTGIGKRTVVSESIEIGEQLRTEGITGIPDKACSALRTEPAVLRCLQTHCLVAACRSTFTVEATVMRM
jgi:hypothetical protein